MRHYKPRTALLTGLAFTSIAAYALGLFFNQVSVRHYLPIFMQAQLAVAVIFRLSSYSRAILSTGFRDSLE